MLLGFGKEVIVKACYGAVGVTVGKVLGNAEDSARGDFAHEVAVEAVEASNVVVHDPMSSMGQAHCVIPAEVTSRPGASSLAVA